jgi:hypothetical protein
MSGYSDHYKDVKQAEFIRRWTDGVTMPPLTDENMRWNVARARAAEAELAEIKEALNVVRKAIT